jgi:hypothetical protein
MRAMSIHEQCTRLPASLHMGLSIEVINNPCQHKFSICPPLGEWANLKTDWTYKACATLLSCQFFMNFIPLKIIVGKSTILLTQMVTRAVTFSRLAEPCLCCVFVPWHPTTHWVWLASGGNPLSFIPYVFFWSNFQSKYCFFMTSLNQWLTMVGLRAHAQAVSGDLLQWVWSLSWCLQEPIDPVLPNWLVFGSILVLYNGISKLLNVLETQWKAMVCFFKRPVNNEMLFICRQLLLLR